jgi:predicted ATPase
MITRLQIDGFKNLRSVDIRLDAFTCVAGSNGVGKSNLFDAVRFLSALADEKKLDEAARTVRDESERSADTRAIFFQTPSGALGRAKFAVEMVIPIQANDDLGQAAKGKTTFVRYELEICYRETLEERQQYGEIQIIHESLTPLRISTARSTLGFVHSREWRDSVIEGRRTTPFISMTTKEGETVIKVHQDGEGKHGSGRTYGRPAKKLPRTVLSSADADTPTMMCARAEMRSWELLQLEPSAMRRADSRSQEPRMESNGAHLPATLARLARESAKLQGGDAAALYQEVGNRMAELLGDVRLIEVEENERTDTLTVFAVSKDGTKVPARSLSDGTLRFLALLAKELDVHGRGVICLEEPENGIHPQRIPAMLRLLNDIAADLQLPSGQDNPLRQIIFNTHSPAVVQQLPPDCILVAESAPFLCEGKQVTSVRFASLQETWRTRLKERPPVTSMGKLLAYLRPAPAARNGASPQKLRLIDSNEAQQILLKLA